MKAIKHEGDNRGYSVLIDTDEGLKVWIDVDTYKGDIRVDWNAYIFNLKNSKDIAISKFQSSADNFSDCSSIAIQYLENNNLIII